VIIAFNWVTAMTLIPPLLAHWTHAFQTVASPKKKFRKRSTRWSVQQAKQGKEWLGPAGAAVDQFYTYFSGSLPLRLLFLAVGLSLVVTFGVFIKDVEMGYTETDLAKDGTFLKKGIDQMYSWVYSQHSSETLVFGTGIDYTRDTGRLISTHNKLKDTIWSATGTAYGRTGAVSNTYLLNLYGDPAVAPLMNCSSLVPPSTNGNCEPQTTAVATLDCVNYYNGTEDPQFYADYHLWRFPQVFLNPRSPSTISFGGIYAVLVDRTGNFAYAYNNESDPCETLGSRCYSVENEIVLSFDEVEMNMRQLQDTKAKVQMIKDFDDILLDSGLNVYMHGWLFVQTNQFIHLDYYFWQACAVSVAAVFSISLLLGMSWIMAALIAFFSIALCVQVYGSLAPYVLDVSYQTLAATTMLMSIGMSVEFIAHPVAAFEFAVGTRAERLQAAMRKTFLPIVEGAFSSFVGFAFCAASDFEFIYKYFFLIFLMICVFGTINAIIFLPAILGLFGHAKETDELREDFSERTSSYTVASAVGSCIASVGGAKQEGSTVEVSAAADPGGEAATRKQPEEREAQDV